MTQFRSFASIRLKDAGVAAMLQPVLNQVLKPPSTDKWWRSTHVLVTYLVTLFL